MSSGDAAPVDTRRDSSVEFAPPNRTAAGDARQSADGAPIAVGPGRTAASMLPRIGRVERGEVNGYPIQQTKVHRPPLREETLTRDRLLDWLHVKIHHRVVFVVAEAGYGKTTLLADFSRRTRLRTIWYRLDDEDRNWVAFLSYLVAAGRAHDPAFAESTARLLRELDSASHSRETVTRAFVRDVVALGDHGAAVIFDDYHLVDDSPDVVYVVGELLAHAPERVTFVFASRREPPVRVARLRALGELAELSTNDLRFSEPETDRLFREAYGHPLEPDVLTDLSRRTEGWAASLQLVQTAIRDRTSAEVRRFVRSLSGAEGDLYDYLAEEVVGDLTAELQDFLMKTSLLQDVDPELARVVTQSSGATARARISAAERLGLLHRSRERSGASQRFHPLVQQFLEDRLKRTLGDDAVAALHRRVAMDAEARGNWTLACHHYAAASDPERLHAVVARDIESIMGSGGYARVESYLNRYPPVAPKASFYIVSSRMHFRDGDVETAVARATEAVSIEPNSDEALANLTSLHLMAGNIGVATDLADDLASRSPDATLGRIAHATRGLISASLDAPLKPIVLELTELAVVHEAAGQDHFEGISRLNCAWVLRARGDAPTALQMATRAIDLLTGSSDGSEVVAARIARAWSLAHMNESSRSSADVDFVSKLGSATNDPESLVDCALILAVYDDPLRAQALLAESRSSLRRAPDIDDQWRVAAAEVAVRQGRYDDATTLANGFLVGSPSSEPCHKLHQLTLRAHIDVARGVDPVSLASATRLAARQDARYYLEQCEMLEAAQAGGRVWSDRLSTTLRDKPVNATILAGIVSRRLNELNGDVLAELEREVRARPTPWRHALRLVVDEGKQSKAAAARLLDIVGSGEDVARLRAFARTSRVDSSVGRQLARRLAAKVLLEDQGKVSIVVGESTIPGTAVRRKVLATLCFLGSRPGMSAARDQILDALWPDLDPDVALNSLNQTVYFLRRVFEPEYKEDWSPGYVHHSSDVVWLDTDLISSRSSRCWALIRGLGADPTPDEVDNLSAAYAGRFALDFAYEEWAVPYRDTLHAAYLQVIENAVVRDTASGNYERGVRLARRALELDPEAEQIELALLRLYARSGAHAAAAEQYSHYSAMVRRDLGVEPLSFQSLYG
jgi:DNA-binding SARP family transcriptional activator